MEPYVRYTAVGDSLTEGIGSEAKHFVAWYASIAEKHLGRPVQVRQWGRSGATTGELLAWITDNPGMQGDIASAELITVTAGGNDLLKAAKMYYESQDQTHLVRALKQYQHQLVRVIRMIRRLKAESDTPYCLRLLNLYNPFAQFEEAVEWVGIFNRQLLRFEDRFTSVVNVYDLFLGREFELLSDDFIHPNDAGYRLMAECAEAVGFAPLVESSL